MRRREFISLIGGGAMVWPLPLRAQQPKPVIGFLGTVAQEVWVKPVAAFEERLREHGWIDGHTIKISELQQAARTKGFQLAVLGAATEQQIDEAFATLAQSHAGALLIGGDPLFASARKQLVAHAASQSIPTMFHDSSAVEDGGLIGYGPSFADAYRLAGEYTGRILKGENPAEMPVVRLDKFNLSINLRTARQLGLTLAPGLIAIADEVIE